MKRSIPMLLMLLAILSFSSCREDKEVRSPEDNKRILNEASAFASVGCADTVSVYPTLAYTPGAVEGNAILVDTLRTFAIYVPSTYDSSQSYPLVIMFHGTGQSARDMIANTTWNQEAEQNGFIVLYPNALRYNVAGTFMSKWNTAGTALLTGISQADMYDDLSFVANMIKTTYGTLNINCDKIYAVGFSNGGGFVKSELRVHMDRAFAATGSAGGPGSDSVLIPDHGIHTPHFEVTGSRDANVLANCALLSLPNTIAGITSTPCIWDGITTMRSNLALDSTYSAIQAGVPLEYTEFVFANSTVGQNTEYKFRMIRNMGHIFPSKKWSTDYVPIFWDWFNQF